jgi:hypothetical protein
MSATNEKLELFRPWPTAPQPFLLRENLYDPCDQKKACT